MNRDELLGAIKRKTEELPVPEWGTTLTIQVMSLADLIAYDEETDNVRKAALAVVGGVVNADGTPVFTKEDVPSFMNGEPFGLMRVAKAIRALSVPTEAKIEDAAKN